MAMKFHTLNGNRCRRSHRAEHRSVSGKASLHHLSRCNILEVGLANRKSYFNEHAGWNPSSRESDCPLPAVDSGPSLPCNNRVPTWVRREAANPRRSFRQRLDFSSWAQRPCNHSNPRVRARRAGTRMVSAAPCAGQPAGLGPSRRHRRPGAAPARNPDRRGKLRRRRRWRRRRRSAAAAGARVPVRIRPRTYKGARRACMRVGGRSSWGGSGRGCVLGG